MEDFHVKHTLRWLFVPLATLGGFFASIILVGVVNLTIHYVLFVTGHVMARKVFLMEILPYDGAIAASFFIYSGAYAAPSHKNIVAFCLLIFGGIIAWQLIGVYHSPVLNFSAHELNRDWWPITGTYIGGICTYVRILLTSRRSHMTLQT
jgi:hypothetical protein